MKSMFKKSLGFMMIMLLTVLALGFSFNVKAAEVVESVDFTTKAANHSAYTDTWTYDGWTVSGGANNNGGWAYVKIGGKNTNIAKYSDYYIASPVVASATSKVEVNIIAGSVAKSGMSATVQLEVYSDSALSTLVDSTAAVTVAKTAALLEFEPTNGVSWPANSYYKVVFNCANTSTTNGIVWLDNVSVYDYNAGDALQPSIELSGDNYTEVDDVVTLTATTANVTSNLVWSSSDSNIATVDQSGNVTAKSMGVATITAAADGAEATFEFTVYPTDGSEITIEQALTICDWVGTAECAFTYSVTGVVETITTAYNSTYDNITVTITDGTNSIQAYRMAGGSDLAEGDKIKVTGILTKYSGNTPQFIAGATYEAIADDAATSAIKDALNAIDSYVSAAYKYTKEEVAAPLSVEFVAEELGYENGVAVESISEEPVAIAFAKGENSNAPKYYNTGKAIRCYGGNTMTFTATDTNITSIELTFATGEGTNAISADCGEFDTDTWTGSSATVVLTIGGTTGHRRIASIKVSYEGGSDTKVTQYSDVDFRFKFGVDSDVENIEGVEKVGVSVTAGGDPRFYTSDSFVVDEENGISYIVISLGDIINYSDRASLEFTVSAYVQIGDIKYYSTSSKTYSAKSIIAEYLELGYAVEGLDAIINK